MPRRTCWGALVALALLPMETGAGEITLSGITFSDELGGFELLGGSGSGTREDPFVIVERINENRPAVLTIRGMAKALRDHPFAFRYSGFSLVKVVVNATPEGWQNFGLGLETPLGSASTYLDGLSFGQAIPNKRPIMSDTFDGARVVDEPGDSVMFSDGHVPPGGRVTFTLIITDYSPRDEFYLRQWREKQISAAPGAGSAEDG